MEKLLKEQGDLGEQIQKLITNIKKDPANRRTKAHLEKRKEEVAVIYNRYKENDKLLIDYEGIDNLPYVEERKHIKRVCDAATADINYKLETAPTTPTLKAADEFAIEKTLGIAATTKLSELTDLHIEKTHSASTSTSPKNIASKLIIPTIQGNNDDPNKKLLRKQLIKINHLEYIITQAYGLINERKEPEYLRQKINQLNTTMEKIDELHEEILLETTKEDMESEDYFKNSMYFEISSLAEDCTAKLQQAVHKKFEAYETKNEQQPKKYRLKEIEIPKFNGNYQDWVGFHELFTKLVEQNENLTDTHKIMYLKTHLEGAASKVIQHLQPIGDNYKSAMEILANKYQNKRLLVNNHINAIFALHNIQQETATAIRILHDTVKENLHAIKNLGVDIATWGAWLVPFLTKKLDSETIKSYEMSLKNPKEIQTTNGLLEFLEQRYQLLETLRLPKLTTTNDSHRHKQQVFNATIIKNQSCILCLGNHTLECCHKFNKMSHIERMQLVNLHDLCRRCLATGHNFQQCSSQSRCKACNGMHHNLLHTKQPLTTTSKSISTNSAMKTHETTLLATAIVKTTRFDGREELLRLLIDTGSQTSFITTEAKQRLNLLGRKINAEVHGVGGQVAGKVNSIVNINLQPRYPSTFSIEIEALVLAKISKNLPETPFQFEKWKHLEELLLADPNYNIPAPIDILLGADYYTQIMKPQCIKGNKNEPAAQLTEFGWVILGRISAPNKSIELKYNSHVSSTEIDQQLKKFWELEEMHPPRVFTKSEKECEEFFRDTHKRLKNGRYELRIPFHKDPTTHLGDSKRMAIARFLQVERRLSRDPNLRQSYTNFMREYEQLNHMEILKDKEDSNVAYYLPHHAVMKSDSTTTKLRVVFDGSAKTTSGESLNNLMLNGPKLQQDLISILMRWRKHKFVMKADIEKMFRQVIVNEEDQDYQRLLWRESPKEEIKTFRLKTVTYGTTSATYLATKVLCQLAQDEINNYPIASTITIRDFYVDDLLSGADTLEEALEAQSQLIQLLKAGGFNLRKWASNNRELITHLPTSAREDGLCSINIDDTIKTLGIIWNPVLDNFGFKISLSDNMKEPSKTEPSKRSILAEVAKLFDPLGWFAPVIIQAKLLMQKLWIAGVGWDETLSMEIQQQWKQFKEGLTEIEDITISRWIEHSQQGQSELHGFSDASEKAFAAVVYYKTTNSQGTPVVYLIAAKTKVAHIKNRISLPRLELCGAVLLAKILKTVQDAMDLKHATTYAWTDSMITLGWIRGDPSKYKTFVGNRIAEIQSLMQPSQWHYVKSSYNPADVASRGMNARHLRNYKLWWEGPSWLKNSNYPITLEPTEEAANEEMKTNCLFVSASPKPELIDFSRFSSTLKIKRTIAYCCRFIAIFKKRIHQVPGEIPSFLTVDELTRSHNVIIKTIQDLEFAADIKLLKTTNKTKNNSKLSSLNPFLDENGLLRVGGRLQRSQLKYDQKHQLILPKNHIYSSLIIIEAHHLVLHGGVQATLAQLRSKYWILNGKRLVRTIIHNCVKCFRFRRTASEQLMGMLPEARVTPSAPFTNTGIDYAGPFAVRVSKGRGNKSYKGYVALFICFSTKAIHLELVSELTTAAFLAAFRRFTSRRGTPLNIYSDNGTNFVGAHNVLSRELQVAVQHANNNAAQVAANHGTTWHFIPPGSPHFGGIWESGIKSMKGHLKKIIGETTLTYEEFSTVLVQIEACLNSRPIISMSNDLNDFDALTPGHFLIGRPLISPPESDKTNISTTQRWTLLSKMTQGFWKVWSKEYLNTVQQRYKWKEPKLNYRIGQLVLIKDEQLPPTKWAMGRITDTHPGSDGLTRVVSLKGPKNNSFKRPITKIALLPIEDNQDSTGTADEQVTTDDNKVGSLKVCRSRNATLTNIVYAPLLILLITFSFCNPSTLPYNITTFENQPGIYFESIGEVKLTNNNWNIIVYYNLSSYYAELAAYKRSIGRLTKYCSYSNENFSNSSINKRSKDTTCGLIEPLFEQSLQEMEHKDELLHHHKVSFGRSKRGLFNLGGNIANELFGVLDDRAAVRYEKEIETLKLNNNHFIALLRNQTSIIDATINVFKHREEDVNKHWLVFKNQLEEALENNNEKNNFLALSIHTILRMMAFKEMQDTLIEAVLDTHNRVITTRLLTTQQLKKEIDLMTRNLQPEIMLPNIDDTDDILALYQLMTAKTRLQGKYLIFEVKLPLVYKEIYQIYKPIPLPTASIPSIYIRPQMELLVTDLHRTTYSSMTVSEWQNCISTNDFSICQLTQPMHQNQEDDVLCELLLLRQEKVSSKCEVVERKKNIMPDTWIQLRDYRWLYSVPTERTISIVCQQQPFSTRISRSGILSLGSGCTLKGRTINIPAKQSYYHKVYSSILPTFNLSLEASKQLQDDSYHFQDLSKIQGIEELQQRIKAVALDTGETLSHHHVHHYALTYGLLALALIGIVFVVVKRKIDANKNKPARVIPLEALV